MTSSLVGSGYYAAAELAATWAAGGPVRVLAYKLLEWTPTPMPGQFYNLHVPGVEAVPLSVAYYDAGSRVVYFIVKARGETTSILVHSPPRRVGLLGPLGRPLKPPEPGGRVLLLGAGTGVAPVAYAASLWRSVASVTLVHATRSAAEAPPLPWAWPYIRLSEDGGTGVRGVAVDVLGWGEWSEIYAAGPKPVLCAVARYCEESGVRCTLILEEMVRCGVGFCGKCRVPGAGLLCRDGPGFPLEVLTEWRQRSCAEHMR